VSNRGSEPTVIISLTIQPSLQLGKTKAEESYKEVFWWCWGKMCAYCLFQKGKE